MAENASLEKVTAWPQRLKEYFGELRQEMSRVSWPNRKQVESTTLVVIVCVFAFAAYFALVDKILTVGVAQIYRLTAK
jgi:preprotein translocase subunit SecE